MANTRDFIPEGEKQTTFGKNGFRDFIPAPVKRVTVPLDDEPVSEEKSKQVIKTPTKL